MTGLGEHAHSDFHSKKPDQALEHLEILQCQTVFARASMSHSLRSMAKLVQLSPHEFYSLSTSFTEERKDENEELNKALQKPGRSISSADAINSTPWV